MTFSARRVLANFLGDASATENVAVGEIESFDRMFSNDDSCLQFLFELRCADRACPRCQRRGQYHRHRAKQCFTCTCGRSHCHPRTGTLFTGSPMPLSKWFLAVFMLRVTPDLPAQQLAGWLDVTYPTAWRMKRRIQAATADCPSQAFEDALLCCCSSPEVNPTGPKS